MSLIESLSKKFSPYNKQDSRQQPERPGFASLYSELKTRRRIGKTLQDSVRDIIQERKYIEGLEGSGIYEIFDIAKEVLVVQGHEDAGISLGKGHDLKLHWDMHCAHDGRGEDFWRSAIYCDLAEDGVIIEYGGSNLRDQHPIKYLRVTNVEDNPENLEKAICKAVTDPIYETAFGKRAPEELNFDRDLMDI